MLEGFENKIKKFSRVVLSQYFQSQVILLGYLKSSISLPRDEATTMLSTHVQRNRQDGKGLLVQGPESSFETLI